jgi:hypothetical protein
VRKEGYLGMQNQTIDSKKNSTLVKTIFLFVIIFLSYFAYIFLLSMERGFDHDENVFISSAILSKDLTIYHDFVSGHLPYVPWFYNLIFDLFSTTHFLLTARVITVISTVVAGALIFQLSHHIGRSKLIAFLCAMIFLSNDILLSKSAVLSSNHILPITLFLASLTFYFWGFYRNNYASLNFLISGILASASIGCRVSMVFVVIPLVSGILLKEGLPFSRRIANHLFPYFIGGIIGALPIFYLFSIEPSLFWFSVFEYGSLNSSYWEGAAPDMDTLVLAGKIRSAADAWFHSSLALVPFVIFVSITFLLSKKKYKTEMRRSILAIVWPWPGWLMISLTGCGIVFALIPTPTFIHYYILPIVPIVLMIPVVTRNIERNSHVFTTVLCIVGFFVSAIVTLQYLGRAQAAAFSLDTWVPIKIHREGERIAGELSYSGQDDPLVATLSPIFPIEGAVRILPEISEGPFAWRSSDLVSPGERRRFKFIGADDIDGFFANYPPNGIYIRYKYLGWLGDALQTYAEEQDYRKVELDYGILYVQP